MITPIDGGPAFPVPDCHHANGQVQYGHNGMTLRDFFAGLAMNGMVADPPTETGAAQDCAELAYLIADEMLAARKGGA